MPNNQLIIAIARLLSNRELRERFRTDPVLVAESIGVAPEFRQEFTRLDADSLCRQAEGLLEKRWREVIQLVPKTVAQLGSESRELFFYYAPSYWPEGHRRHALDAVKFLSFLSRNRLAAINQEELKKVRRAAAG